MVSGKGIKFSRKISIKKGTVAEEKMRQKDTEAALNNTGATTQNAIQLEESEGDEGDEGEEGEEDEDDDIFNVIQRNISTKPSRNVNDI